MSEPYQPDPELVSLVDALIDRRLDAEGSRRLADRLRAEPDAMGYCASMMRLDAAIQDELCPQEMEWTDVRRVKLSRGAGGPGLEVQRNQSLRVGHGGDSGAALLPDSPVPPVRRWSRWWLLVLLAALIPGGWLLYHRLSPTHPPAAPKVVLLNPSFEATDLTYLTEPTNRALVDWQDYFVTENADVAEISRVTDGKVLPKSGRNVARLTNFAYLTQRLRKSDSSPLLAKPGLRIAVSGWAYVMEEPPAKDAAAPENANAGTAESIGPHGLRVSLRFVAGGSPGMVQYEAAGASTPLKPGDWQPFRVELALPEDLVLPSSHGVVQNKLDLNGKNLTLSLDSLCEHGYQLLLDDLGIEEIR